jgi:hypothetical protein
MLLFPLGPGHRAVGRIDHAIVNGLGHAFT